MVPQKEVDLGHNVKLELSLQDGKAEIDLKYDGKYGDVALQATMSKEEALIALADLGEKYVKPGSVVGDALAKGIAWIKGKFGIAAPAAA